MRFSVLAYNQEELILYTLESIRWQIENHGNLEEDEIIVYDDCSSDDTVKVCEEWFAKNNMNAPAYRVVSCDRNQGTVKNYLRAAENAIGMHNKIIAGDDLFSQENVYEVASSDGFTFSPVAIFIDGHVLNVFPGQILGLYKAKCEGRLEEVYREKWSKFSPVIAPAIFYPSNIFADQGLVNEMSQYIWIEDQPMWYYEFIEQGKISQVSISSKCYILYRGSGGISTTFRISTKSGYALEADRVDSHYHPKRGNALERGIRPVLNKIHELLILRRRYMRDRKMRGFLLSYKQSHDKAAKHLELIISRTNEYKSSESKSG